MRHDKNQENPRHVMAPSLSLARSETDTICRENTPSSYYSIWNLNDPREASLFCTDQSSSSIIQINNEQPPPSYKGLFGFAVFLKWTHLWNHVSNIDVQIRPSMDFSFIEHFSSCIIYRMSKPLFNQY